jgi:hypothetical protein
MRRTNRDALVANVLMVRYKVEMLMGSAIGAVNRERLGDCGCAVVRLRLF